MPIKVYTDKQKEEIKIQLLETGLKMYSKHGVKNVKLMDILKRVGISKPFFYSFYPSLPEFIIAVLEYQWNKIEQFLDRIDKEYTLNWEKRVYKFIHSMVYYSKNEFLILTQKEEEWLYQRLDGHLSKALMDRQTLFFEDLLKRWGISKEKYTSRVFSNAIVSIAIIHNSSRESLPFMFHDDLDNTVDFQITCLINYLKILKKDS